MIKVFIPILFLIACVTIAVAHVEVPKEVRRQNYKITVKLYNYDGKTIQVWYNVKGYTHLTPLYFTDENDTIVILNGNYILEMIPK